MTSYCLDKWGRDREGMDVRVGSVGRRSWASDCPCLSNIIQLSLLLHEIDPL